MSGYDYRRFSVLFVDDEQQARKYFRMALEKDFDVLTAASANEADEQLDEHGAQIGIVVSDQRMPGEGGASMLGRVRRRFPHSIRILTTAYADMQAAIDAVNSGAIYKYIVKPWDINDLRATLKRAMEYRILREERDLLVQEKLSSLQHLLVADRVRSLAVLARGLSHHVRNALTALEAYVFLAKDELSRAPAVPDTRPDFWHSVWNDAELVNRQLLRLVESVTDATVEPDYRFDDQVELSSLIADGARQAEVAPESLHIAGEPTGDPVVCDRALMTRMFSIFFHHLRRVSPESPTLHLEHLGQASVWDQPAQLVRLRGNGEWDHKAMSSLFTPFSVAQEAPTEVRPDLLAAFFIVYHHGGTVQVHTNGPEGPGFDLTLPNDPTRVERPPMEDGLLERLFFHTEEWDKLERDV